MLVAPQHEAACSQHVAFPVFAIGIGVYIVTPSISLTTEYGKNPKITDAQFAFPASVCLIAFSLNCHPYFPPSLSALVLPIGGLVKNSPGVEFSTRRVEKNSPGLVKRYSIN